MSDDESPSLATLRAARDEARETLEHQARTADDLDGKAVNLLQFDASVATIAASAVTAAKAVGVAPTALVNRYTVLGVVALFCAAVVAGVAYTMNAQYGGVGATPVATAVREDAPPERFYRRLVAGYAVWIRENRRRNARRTPLVTVTMLTTVAAMAALALGAAHALLGGLPVVVPLVGVVAVGVAAYASRLHAQVARAVRTTRFAGASADSQLDLGGVDPFRGEQVSTGADNREG